VEDVVKEDYGMEYFDFKMEQRRLYAHEGHARVPTAVINVRAFAI